MNSETNKAPPLPPRIPLPNYPTKRRNRNVIKSELDIVPPPPSFKPRPIAKINLSQSSSILSQNSLNTPSSDNIDIILDQNKINLQETPILNNSSLNSSNQINNFNNNYYGLNCNYFTVPSLSNSNYNSLNTSPIHDFSHLIHSNSFPNFSILNASSNNFNNYFLNQSNQQSFFENKNCSNQSSNNLLSPNDLKYQELILSKLESYKINNNLKKLSNDNLIDLGTTDENELKNTSVLNLFDPLTVKEQKIINGNSIKPSSDKNNVKEDKNNLDQDSNENNHTHVYEQVVYEKDENKSLKNITKKEIIFNNNLDYLKHRNLVANTEIINFKNKLISIRNKYSSKNVKANLGYVISSRLKSPKDTCLSVKLVIDSTFKQDLICFTCNVNTSVEHVLCHAVCSIFDSSTLDFNNYILKIYGLNEYLVNESYLGDYAYVNSCYKFDTDVKLTLVDKSKNPINIYARTEKDDELIENINEYDILPNLLLCKFSEISYENIKILLSTIDDEASKLLGNNNSKSSIIKNEYLDKGKFLSSESNQRENTQTLLTSVKQAIKALCSQLGFETMQLIEAQKNLEQLYVNYENYKIYSQGSKINESIEIFHPEIIGNAILTIKKAIYSMLHFYSKVFPVNFYCKTPESEKNYQQESMRKVINIQDFDETLICKIDNLSLLNYEWSIKYESYYFKCELIHGEKILAAVNTKPSYIDTIDRLSGIDFNEYINFESVTISSLPRETYLYFTLIGIQSQNPNDNSIEKEIKAELGITSIRLFDHQNKMIEGQHLLGLWPEKYGFFIYKTVIRESYYERNCPLLVINLLNTGNIIKFPDINNETLEDQNYEYSLNMFDEDDHANIYHILNHDPLDQMTYEDKQTLWEKREKLTDVPSALPKILCSAPSWQASCLKSTYRLIKKWKSLAAIDAMQLLLPSYADKYVRETAIMYIKNLDDDEIYDYLPQLVHAIRYETNLDSPLIWLLFEKSFSNLKIAHHFYWLLKTSLNDPLISWRMQVLMNSFLCTCSSSLKKTLMNQEKMLKELNEISDRLKKEKENRMKVLTENLEIVHNFLIENHTTLPLNLSMEITGLDLNLCNYFNSNTLPIKLAFKTANNLTKEITNSLTCMPKSLNIDALYKVGDDLRQDTITMQMINIMDKLWLKEGLDLKLITFKCIATDERKGFIEMVKNSETLRRIQSEKGVTGSFKDNSIATWLQKHNTVELEYEQAVNNFTLSCAGYAVATYVLGIGDRHNDNIMLTTAGHLFHIDFGKFLGDAQMIGSIKRDRVPFVLTSDMAYVINCGDKPSIKFQNFIDICCQAYNIIRHNSSLFLSLFSLMLSANIPGLTPESIKYVHNALKPTLTDCRANEEFNKLISETLSSKSTQINFFIHNLAQMRFSSEYDDQKNLSFVPKIFTLETEGIIQSITVEKVIKYCEQNKQYYYVFSVIRFNQKEPQRILRSYKEVYELNTKLSTFFRLSKFYPLSRPKSNSREFTSKKLYEVRLFFEDLMQTSNEILRSDFICTFFHPLLRDQESNSSLVSTGPLFKGTLNSNINLVNRYLHCGNGEIKLSILHKNEVLLIMIMHARNLYSIRSTAPDTYVKTYLLPDPYKHSKRKTKVIYKNTHPTFLEMITYDKPLEELYKYHLEVSVWHYQIGDREKKLLGASVIQLKKLDLSKEIIDWYPLTLSSK